MVTPSFAETRANHRPKSILWSFYMASLFWSSNSVHEVRMLLLGRSSGRTTAQTQNVGRRREIRKGFCNWSGMGCIFVTSVA